MAPAVRWECAAQWKMFHGKGSREARGWVFDFPSVRTLGTLSLSVGTCLERFRPGTQKGAQLGMFISCWSSVRIPRLAPTITSTTQTFTSSYIQHGLIPLVSFCTFCSEPPACPYFTLCMCWLLWLFPANSPSSQALWVEHWASRACP